MDDGETIYDNRSLIHSLCINWPKISTTWSMRDRFPNFCSCFQPRTRQRQIFSCITYDSLYLSFPQASNLWSEQIWSLLFIHYEVFPVLNLLSISATHKWWWLTLLLRSNFWVNVLFLFSLSSLYSGPQIFSESSSYFYEGSPFAPIYQVSTGSCPICSSVVNNTPFLFSKMSLLEGCLGGSIS